MAKKASAKKKAGTKKGKSARASRSAKSEKALARAKSATAKKSSAKRPRATKSRIEPERFAPYEPRTSPRGRGAGTFAAGQSGDIQGLPREEDVDPESVEELAEEGQDFEAEAIGGVEDAPDPDEGEVRTHEVPEDDVPPEYREPQG